jgi:response regulator RpfG family c-di-GMP phosphodiesterase
MRNNHLIRRPRAVIIDDDIVIVALLRTYLQLRGYEVFSYREPRVCPVYDDDAECGLNRPCADIMLVDFNMARMNGIDLLNTQSARKCKLTPKNKALITGYADLLSQSIIDEMSYAFFEKPLDFNLLAAWFDECEERFDLSQPLGVKRKEIRLPSDDVIQYRLRPDHEVLNGIAINMSASGICMRINTPLLREQTISILSDRAKPRPASVKWLKDAGNGGYIAGLHQR